MKALGIDVGVHGLAWGLMRGGKFIAVGYVANPCSGDARFGPSAWDAMAWSLYKRSPSLTFDGADAVIIERMQRDRRTEGQVVDNLLTLQAIVGATAAVARAVIRPRYLLTPTPDEWTLGTPKKVRHNRLTAKYPELPELLRCAGIPAERLNDVLDGCGLAAWGYAPLSRGRLPRKLSERSQ